MSENCPQTANFQQDRVHEEHEETEADVPLSRTAGDGAESDLEFVEEQQQAHRIPAVTPRVRRNRVVAQFMQQPSPNQSQSAGVASGMSRSFSVPTVSNHPVGAPDQTPSGGCQSYHSLNDTVDTMSMQYSDLDLRESLPHSAS